MLNPADLLNIGRDTKMGRLDGYEIYIFYAVEADCPTCEYDPQAQASTDLACPTCGGRGHLVTFYQSQIKARINWQNDPHLTVIRGGQMWEGDITLLVAREDQEIFDRLIASRYSYLQVGDHKLRPQGTHDTGVGAEVAVPCKVVESETLRY